MRCPYCGAEWIVEVNVCPKCGAELDTEGKKICPACKIEYGAKKVYCSECGSLLKKTTAEARKKTTAQGAVHPRSMDELAEEFLRRQQIVPEDHDGKTRNLQYLMMMTGCKIADSQERVLFAYDTSPGHIGLDGFLFTNRGIYARKLIIYSKGLTARSPKNAGLCMTWMRFADSKIEYEDRGTYGTIVLSGSEEKISLRVHWNAESAKNIYQLLTELQKCLKTNSV